MGIFESVALALGAAWGSGLSLYATVLVLGGLQWLGIVDMPPALDILASPPVLIVAGVLYAVEFIADKVPGLDTLSDIVHTFIRIPAGAALALGAIDGVDPTLLGDGRDIAMIAALVGGGTVSAATHLAKAGGRALINTSPEPFSNWFASLFEDVLVVLGVALAVVMPLLFVVLLGLFFLLLAWLLPRLWRSLRRLADGLRRPRAPARNMRAGRGFDLTASGGPDG